MKLRNENGVTVVALVVSIIVIAILATVTVQTSYKAYQTTQADALKAKLKVIQEAVTTLNNDWVNWQEQQYSDTKYNKWREEKVSAGETENLDANSYLKEVYSITKYLELKYGYKTDYYNFNNIPGISSGNSVLSNAQISIEMDFYGFQHTSANTQKVRNGRFIYVDPTPEEIEADEILFAKRNLYKDIFSCKFYKFSENDAKATSNPDISPEKILGIKDIDIDFYVDYENLFVFATLPVTVDGTKVYTQFAFADAEEVFIKDSIQTNENLYMKITEVANYGLSKRIKIELVDDSNPNFSSKIDKIYYSIVHSYGTYNTIHDGAYKDVESLGEFEYSDDGKYVTFLIDTSGRYLFKIKTNDKNYVTAMKVNNNLNVLNKDTEESPYEQTDFYYAVLCNAPVLNSDMVPVKWIFNDTSRREGKWIVCSTSDPEWYNYAHDKKMWANVMMLTDCKTTNIKVGSQIAESQVGSMFVWIPRYQTRGAGSEIYIPFVRNLTGIGTDGKRYYIGTSMDNWAFTVKEWNTELKGIWYSKYDVSVENSVNSTAINTNNPSEGAACNKMYESGQNFRLVSKPYRVVWKNISFVNAYSQALLYYDSLNNARNNKDINSHLMKLQESYTLYRLGTSVYGNQTMTANNANARAGGSDGVNGMSLTHENIANQSTTKNITGIYDVKGTITEFLANLKRTNNSDSFIYTDTGKILNYLPVSIATSGYSNIDDIYKEKTLDSNHEKYLGMNNTIHNDLNPTGEAILKNIPGSGSEEYMTLSEADSGKYGFRIVLVNSPSADRESLIYDKNPNEEKFAVDGFYELLADGTYRHYSIQGMHNRKWLTYSEETGRNGETITKITKGDNKNQLANLNGVMVLRNINIIGSQYDYVSAPFSDCRNFTKVILGDKTQIIGYNSFGGSTNLKEVELGKNIVNIYAQAFNGCSNLVNVRLPDNLTSLGDSAFKGTKVETIKIPATVSRVGNSCFENCYSLSLVQFETGSSYVTIGDRAFAGDISLKTFCVTKNITSIGSNAFAGDYGITKFEFDSSYSANLTLSSYALANLINIKNIQFPSRVTSIGSNCFENCSNLESVDMSSSRITYIPYRAFNQTTNLRTISFPSCLSSFGEEAFYGNYTTSFDLPYRFSSIGRSAFYGCSRSLYYPGTRDDWYDNVYKASGWSNGAGITVYTSDYPEGF